MLSYDIALRSGGWVPIGKEVTISPRQDGSLLLGNSSLPAAAAVCNLIFTPQRIRTVALELN